MIPHATKADIALLERHIKDEHAALEASDPGRALYLSGLFHMIIARKAEELMRSHLVDLHSALDLRERATSAGSLKEVLTLS